MKGGKHCFSPLLFHLLECAPIPLCTKPAHTNTPKAVSTTAFSSCFKIFHMKRVKHVPLSLLWQEEAEDCLRGHFLFHVLLIMNIACAAFCHKNSFSSYLITHYLLFSKRPLHSEIFSVF